MKHLHNFSDERVTTACAYCGGEPNTRDHIPPKVFLDEPLPENVHHVGACLPCNNSLSLDEEYVACLIECARLGTTDPSFVERRKIQRILQKSPALAARITNSMQSSESGATFDVELPRVRKVFEKLVRAHALFEENVSTESPGSFTVVPIHLLSRKLRTLFEMPPASHAWPEVGSRAMFRLVVAGNDSFAPDWIEVQPDRYRYLTSPCPLTVRIVVSEYIACEAVWDS